MKASACVADRLLTFGAIGLFVFLSGNLWPAQAADQTWTGKLSDDACGASHQKQKRASASLTDRECTIECIRSLRKYVLVESGGKVWPIVNQDFAGLPLRADRLVKLTGELKDGAIFLSSVSSLEPDVPAKNPAPAAPSSIRDE